MSQDIRPYIVVIDSGVGGLSLFRKLSIDYKEENILYYADTAHFPYGEKDIFYIQKRYKQILAELLASYPIKMIIVACHTASVAIASLTMRLPFPVFTMIQPTLSAIREALSKVDKMVLLSTRLTATSGIYITPSRPIDIIPCPELVLQIERAQKIDFSIPLDKYDGIILGCTHFHSIKHLLPPVLIIDPVEHVLHEVGKTVEKPEVGQAEGDRKILASSNTECFRQRAVQFMEPLSYLLS